jgi:hypothetical protein
MIDWLIEYKDLLLFGQGIIMSMAIYRVAARAQSNGHRSKSVDEITLNVEDVFEQRGERQSLRNGHVSKRYVGTRVKPPRPSGRGFCLTAALRARGASRSRLLEDWVGSRNLRMMWWPYP